MGDNGQNKNPTIAPTLAAIIPAIRRRLISDSEKTARGQIEVKTSRIDTCRFDEIDAYFIRPFSL
jgi:hypothetical protein